MSAAKQLVICLNRLTLPIDCDLKRITLSIQNTAIEYFIQNAKTVRGERINFYRENVFVQSGSLGLRFNLYSVQENGTKKEVASVNVGTQEINGIHKKPKAFKTAWQGYELLWDSWVFSEDSSLWSQESSRDYTELDLPLNHLENNQSLNSSHSQYFESSVHSNGFSYQKKRSNSTDEASTTEERQPDDAEENTENNFSQSSPQKIKVVQASLIKKRGNVGLSLYQKMPSGISRIISQQ